MSDCPEFGERAINTVEIEIADRVPHAVAAFPAPFRGYAGPSAVAGFATTETTCFSPHTTSAIGS